MSDYRRSPDDILALFRQRQAEMHPLRRGALEVRAVANGDLDALALPMPELDGVDDKNSVANLLLEGLDGASQRDASTFPEITSAALKKGDERSERYAGIRKRAAGGWAEMNRLPVKMSRRARHLRAYAMSPVMIRPDRRRRIPRWQVCDPLSSYPGPVPDPEDVDPPDIILAHQRSFTWLLQNYPERIAALHVGAKANGDDMFDVLEYVDAEQITLLVIGRPRTSAPMPSGKSTGWYSGVGKKVTVFDDNAQRYGGSEIVVLEALPNRAERCTAVVPNRITLDRAVGQYDTMLGKYYWQARLSALELIAIERGVFPSEWVVYEPNADGQIVTVADGRKGIVGEIQGGQYHVTNVNPGYKTTEALDRLERAMRHDGKIPAEMGGESPTNIRTDRRGISVFGNAIDFDRMEVQRVFEQSLETELSVAVDVDRGYFGEEKKSFFVNWRGVQGPLNYTPNKHFEDGSRLIARYAVVGADAGSLTVQNAQKVGADMMSRRTAMSQDPSVEDAEDELDRIESEQLRRAVIASFQAQAENGQIPPIDALRIAELRDQGTPLYEAIRKAHEESQARQAAQTPPGAPEAQPGLSAPGMGAEAGGGGAAAPAPPTLETLLSGLRLPNQPQQPQPVGTGA